MYSHAGLYVSKCRINHVMWSPQISQAKLGWVNKTPQEETSKEHLHKIWSHAGESALQAWILRGCLHCVLLHSVELPRFALNNLPQGTRQACPTVQIFVRAEEYPTEKQDPTELCAVPGHFLQLKWQVQSSALYLHRRVSGPKCMWTLLDAFPSRAVPKV